MSETQSQKKHKFQVSPEVLEKFSSLISQLRILTAPFIEDAKREPRLQVRLGMQVLSRALALKENLESADSISTALDALASFSKGLSDNCSAAYSSPDASSIMSSFNIASNALIISICDKE